MRFLGYILATIIGLFLFFTISFFLLVGLASLSGDQTVEVAENSILRIDLSRPLKEKITTDNPFEDLNLPGFDQTSPIGLVELKQAIANAAEDDRISGIYLELGLSSAGYAQLREVREALLKFKETSGKFVVAYGDLMSESAYYVSSVADNIYMSPSGFMEFDGFSVTVTFLTGTFEKIGVKPEIFRVGRYKSAVEPFLLKEMSEENRQQNREYINSLHSVYLNDLSNTVGKSYEVLSELSDAGMVREAFQAVEAGLITDTLHYDQLLDKFREKLDLEADGKVKFISLNRYMKAEKPSGEKFSKNKIQVIIAEGTVVMGDDSDGNVAGEDIAKAFRKAREDKNVKAVVLRINSPGGVALAAEKMHREIMLTAREKPVIASMSDVAASAGYMIAAPCDTILAQPNTITGSIGIFLLFFTAEELLTDKMGLSFDKVKTGQLSDFGGGNEPLSPLERQILQSSVNRGYADFLRIVADGRGMTIEQVEEVASGRVWTGEQALNNGLVDLMGDMDDAIRIAAAKAGVEDDYRLAYHPEKQDFFSALLKGSSSSMTEAMMRKELGSMYPYFQQFKRLEQMQGLQAIVPFDPRVK